MRGRQTHIHHGDFLRAGAGMVGSVGQHAVRMLCTHVLVQVVMQLLSVFPEERSNLKSDLYNDSKYSNI